MFCYVLPPQPFRIRCIRCPIASCGLLGLMAPWPETTPHLRNSDMQCVKRIHECDAVKDALTWAHTYTEKAKRAEKEMRGEAGIGRLKATSEEGQTGFSARRVRPRRRRILSRPV